MEHNRSTLRLREAGSRAAREVSGLACLKGADRSQTQKFRTPLDLRDFLRELSIGCG